eukprot:1145549-Amorphochlora_amoeboformis.AAC.1
MKLACSGWDHTDIWVRINRSRWLVVHTRSDSRSNELALALVVIKHINKRSLSFDFHDGVGA